jgi:DNA-binding transcriptional LysR family regulator
MNLEYLRTYLKVVKLGSLSEAAKDIFISQPAISAQIKSLEKELDVRLIDRGKSGVSMTPAGRMLFNFAEYVCHEYYYMLRNIEHTRGKNLSELNIVTSPVSSEYILPAILSEFRENHTLTSLSLEVSASSLKVAEDVKNGVYEIGFCSTREEALELEYTCIVEADIVLITYPGHPLASREEISLSDLTGESIVLREPAGVKVGDTKLLIEAGLDLDDFKCKYVMGTMAGVISTVEARVGIAFLPSIVAKKSEVLGLVKVLKVKGLDLKRSFYYVCRKSAKKSPLLQEFTDFIDARTSLKHAISK